MNEPFGGTVNYLATELCKGTAHRTLRYVSADKMRELDAENADLKASVQVLTDQLQRCAGYIRKSAASIEDARDVVRHAGLAVAATLKPTDAASEPAPNPHDWPEDRPHENGNYQGRCITCGSDFRGHKRRQHCKACDAHSADAASEPGGGS